MDTKGKLRGRTAARKLVKQRKERIDAEERKRYEHETDLAADYLLACADRERAREALRRSEAKIGRVITSMIDELGTPYPRLAVLFEESEQELKRLRKVATDEQRPSAPHPPGQTAVRASGQPRPANPEPAPTPDGGDGSLSKAAI